MFNERLALKMRLEQLVQKEIKLFEQIESERTSILNRLIELDELDFEFQRENYIQVKLPIQ